MFNIILHNPEIPPNTGNIMRICSNTGSKLHLIKPLGFNLSDKKLKRASMDYNEIKNIKIYNDICDCINTNKFKNIYAFSKFSKINAFNQSFLRNDAFLFGSETSGLPGSVLKLIPKQNNLRIPMLPKSRSLNLGNSVSIIIYEAWRQNKFIDAQISFVENNEFL